MTTNVLVAAFFGLFILFLIESIYFLRKKLSIGQQTPNEGQSGYGGKFIFIPILIIAVFIVAYFGWQSMSKQKGSTANTTANRILPTDTPTQPPTPTLSEIVFSYPTVTEISVSPTPTSTTKTMPTKTPTPTKNPSPTPTPSPFINKPTATPTISSPIGGPAATVTDTPIPTTAVVIVPKTPVAGSFEQTLIMFLLGISTVAVGLIL